MALQDHIIRGYQGIVEKNEQVGAEAQRQSVCRPIYDPISSAYRRFAGYEDEANLGLGCGFPFLYAGIAPGHAVLDLGCAAGIDVFIAASMVGAGGRVTGIDLTPSLVARAAAIAERAGLRHVQFLCGDISDVPLPSQSFDVIISNGVFSLVADLDKVFGEVKRLLRPGGVFCLADITRSTAFEATQYEAIKAFTGCLNGIRRMETYVAKMEGCGLGPVSLVHQRMLALPAELSAQAEDSGLYISTLRAAG